MTARTAGWNRWWATIAVLAGVAAAVCVLTPGARTYAVLALATGLAALGLAAASSMQRDMEEEADAFLSGFDPPSAPPPPASKQEEA